MNAPDTGPFSPKLKSLVIAALGGPNSPATNTVRSWLRGRKGPPAPRPASPDSSTTSDAVKERRIRRYFKNGHLPSEFSINLGAAPCNHSCLFCPQSIKKPRKAAWLKLDLLEKVLTEMPDEGVTIHLSSYSETLAAPNLVDAVRLMKRTRPKLRVAMATNGSLFREDVIRQVIEAGLDQYQYSFDAPTRETFNRLIQVDHFDRVEQNLERIIAMRDEIGTDMVINTHVMDFKETDEANKAFLDKWNRRLTGGDSAVLRRVANWGGGEWGINDQLISKGFTPKFEAAQERYPCASIFTHFKLQHDGRYAPCVAAVPDFVPEEEMHDTPYLGDAREITWGEAWERLSEMRKAHLRGEWDKYECCRTCNIWGLWDDVWTDARTADSHGTRFTIPGVVYASCESE